MGPELPARSRRGGMALVMAIVITAVCIVIITALTNYIVVEYRMTHLNWQQRQALYCAEAGVDWSAYVLRYSPSITTLSETRLSAFVPGADGTFEARIDPLQSNGVSDPIGGKQITVTGYVPDKRSAQATRTVTALYGSRSWEMGIDAVSARTGIDYGSNNNLTVVVDDAYNTVIDPSVDASIRVTGTGPTSGAIDSVAANLGHVAGSVRAPGFVDILGGNATAISGSDPSNYVPDAFPDPSVLGAWDADGDLIWPPPAGTWARDYLTDALAGGWSFQANGASITGSKYIDLYGSGTLRNAHLTGPGTVFVHGNLGANVTNGSPPVTLVISGDFETGGNEWYRYNRDPSAEVTPSLIVFGKELECEGNSNWYLNGPLLALNPAARVVINDSAMGVFGAILSNGSVYFKSSKGTLGFPRFLSGQRLKMNSVPGVVSYSAQ